MYLLLKVLFFLYHQMYDIPMVIAKKMIFKIFLIATIFSVLGGIFGYLIGAFFFDLGMNIMSFYGMKKK